MLLMMVKVTGVSNGIVMEVVLVVGCRISSGGGLWLDLMEAGDGGIVQVHPCPPGHQIIKIDHLVCKTKKTWQHKNSLGPNIYLCNNMQCKCFN